MGSRNSRVRIRNETNDTIRVMLVKYNKYGETVKLFNTRKLKNNELIQINSIKYGRYTLKVFDMTGIHLSSSFYMYFLINDRSNCTY